MKERKISFGEFALMLWAFLLAAGVVTVILIMALAGCFS